MSFLAAPAAKAAVAIGGSFLGDAFRDDSAQNIPGGVRQFRPTEFIGGGLTGKFKKQGRRAVVTSDPERQALVGTLAQLFPEQAGLVSGLRERVAPGFGELTERRVSAIRNRAERAIGNLRENLQRRRVFGSSFGQDALSRAEAEFAQEEGLARAETFLQELDLTNNLINQEFNLRRSGVQTQLNELNLQADLAADLASSATSQFGANARIKEQLAVQQLGAGGQFFGNQVIQPFQSAIGDFFTNRQSLSSIGRSLAASTTVL